MGFTETLTVLFIILKLVGVIDWKWVFVLLPEIIAVGFYVAVRIIINILDRRTKRRFKF